MSDIERFVFISFALILLNSCSHTDALPEINGRFVHNIPDCDNSAKPEMNCTEFMEFVNENEVDLRYGGGDIVYQFNYKITKDRIFLEEAPTSSFKVSFEILDVNTLRSLDTHDIWKKVS